MSIPFDFFIKTTGKADFRHDIAAQLPLIDGPLSEMVRLRTLILICLTSHYKELWRDCWKSNGVVDQWAKDDIRLKRSFFPSLSDKWNRCHALRNDFERRQALIEIDVLVSMILGLSVDELRTIYRVQFSVLRQNEADTWYDQNGRIVFTCSRGLTGVGFSRPEWNNIKDMRSGIVERVITDDTMPGGPCERTIVYQAPFDRCDREKDYETVWAEFERRFGTIK